VTSYTQIAAFVANGLLLGVTRSKPDAYLRHVTVALREWAKRQHFPRDPDPTVLWVSRMSELRRRRLKDPRMLDALRLDPLGTLAKPINRSASCGTLSTAVALGAFYEKDRMTPDQLMDLTADLAALTHGSHESIFSAVLLAYLIAAIRQVPERPLAQQVEKAADTLQARYGDRYPVRMVTEPVRKALQLAEQWQDPRTVMEELECSTAAQALAGAVYASIRYEDDFDGAMICAVNHSGASCAVGAVTGSILGAIFGADGLPDFYLEGLECAPILRELADDMTRGTITAGLFDTEWDQKYIQGIPTLSVEE
jgi:ADP-ribosylglycohydrolase